MGIRAARLKPTLALNPRLHLRSQWYCRPPMTMAPRPLAPRLLTALICAGLAMSAGAQDEIRLPDLGSSANALISPTEAQANR